MTPTASLICLLRMSMAATAAAAAATAVEQPSRQQCPCAYLERGGFWDSPTAVSLGVADRVYRERRCSCLHEVNCEWNWRSSDKSLTLAWLGSQDTRDSEIQLQFCAAVFPPGTMHCNSNNSTAFTLRQTGWWIHLHEAPRCRCDPDGGPATIRSFRYAEPLESGEKLRDQTVEFACGGTAVCRDDQPCYRETLDERGRRIGGRVQCACPPDSYCPIYTGQGSRPKSAAAAAASNDTGSDRELDLGGTGPGSELLCLKAES